MDKEKIRLLSKKYEPEAIRDRHWLHQHPELSNQEFETTEYICHMLDEIGVPWERPTPTGVIATIQGEGGSGRTLGLRGDIDALPIQELTDLPYKSIHDGVMHACGHDSHAVNLLTTARMLMEMRQELKGTVKLIFQPAEEYFPSGARQMLDSGKLDDVDAFVGIHEMSALPTGRLAVQNGAIFAASCTIRITVHGKGGHGGMPQTAVDATLAAAAVLVNLQSFVSRELAPYKPLVVTIGTFHSGTERNIISEKAEMMGTIRYYDPDEAQHFQEALRRIAEHTAMAHNASADVEFIPGLESIINDPSLVSMGQQTAEELFGTEALATVPQNPGCDDFCYYGEHKPAMYVIVGSANKELGTDYPHHNPHFNVDDKAVLQAAEFFTAFALQYCGEE